MSTSTWPSIPERRAMGRCAPPDQTQPLQAGLLTFALLLSLTLWIWHSSVGEARHFAQERFAFRLEEAQSAISQRLLAYEQVLRGGVALFAASREVTREEWAAYARTLEIERNFPGIQAIGYAPLLAPAALPAFLDAVRAELPDYTLHPAGARASYAPLLYIEPYDWRNMRAAGLDMLADPLLRAPLDGARDSGQPAVSGKLRLASEIDDGVQNNFIICLPAWRRGAPHAALAERRAALSGFVCATFRMGDLMQGILGQETLPDIRMRIFDGTIASPRTLMYDTLAGAAAPAAALAFNADKTFSFDGHNWTLRFDALPAFEAASDTQKTRIMLFGGLLVSVLFAAVAWSLSLNRQRAAALAGLNAGLEAQIAERSKLEHALTRARDAAEAANQAKSDFLANVSHELRTPLTLILAPLEQLLAAPADGTRVHLERAQRNALLLLNRVNDILDYSKAEAGKFTLHPQPLDLAALLAALAEDAADAVADKGCTLSWRVDPAVGALCLDPGHLEKILLNLLSNAIKFTPAGGSIDIEALPCAGARFELSVRDTGIGIAPERMALLFQRFSQIDNSATRQYSGTGIGLALVRELARQMDGEAGADSTPGQGSRFFVRLPCRLPEAAPDAQADSRTLAQRRLRLHEGGVVPAAAAHQASRPGQPSVLVVDDNPDMLGYVSELLGEEYDLATAADGEQAWALLQRRHIDLILSDVMMPGLDGLGLTARIKASAGHARLPVILLTARGGSDASAAGLEGGADDYLAKPFSPEELRARVRAALRMSQMQAQLRDQARQAGMAEIATNVLHNVGNVLNSVNISAGLVSSAVRGSRAPGLVRAVTLIRQHGADLGQFFSADPRGLQLPAYLEQLAAALAQEQRAILDELALLCKSVDHIKDVIATQQSYAGGARVVELVQPGELIEDALRMQAGSLMRHEVHIERQYAELPLLPLDRHRVLQILVNLISNAKHAMSGACAGAHLLTLSAAMLVGPHGARLRIGVADQGEGIAPENLTRIFHHGFSTRANGHGFGLHSCATAAAEMGGTLSVHSDGPGRGALFTLELPIHATPGKTT